MARLYWQAEAAFYWSLSPHDFSVDPRSTTSFSCTAKGGKLKAGDPLKQPLDALLGKLVGDGSCPAFLSEYYEAARRYEKQPRNKGTSFTPLNEFCPLKDPANPLGGHRNQDAEEQTFVKEVCAMTYYTTAVVRGVRFATQSYSATVATNNSGITAPYPASKGTSPDGVAYGEIVSIFSVTVSGVTHWAAHVSWFEFVQYWETHMPIVRKPTKYKGSLNELQPVVWLKDIYAMNCAYWPDDLDTPGNGVLACLWRNSDYRVHQQ